MKQKKIIHVELLVPFNNQIHFYFDSVTAIYDTLPQTILGVKKEYLWRVLRINGIHTTKNAIIRYNEVNGHKTNRGLTKQQL